MSAVVVDVTKSPSAKSPPSFPTIDEISEVIKALIEKQFNECRLEMVASIRSELGKIRATVGDLSNRVRIFEENSLTSCDRSASYPGRAEEVIAEINDRQFRAGNLIIHGLSELPNATPDLARGHDFDSVRSILNQLQIMLISGCIGLGSRRAQPLDHSALDSSLRKPLRIF